MATIYTLSLSARARMNMHSLNNEGSEGNQIQTRMVDVLGSDDQLHSVNAVSGDMFKHIFAEHLRRLLAEQGQPLCAGCQVLDPNRINADPSFQEKLKDKSWTDVAALDQMIQQCALDDIAGNLVTAEKRSIPRKSVIEFGWVLGIPERVSTDSYFHVKYATERGATARSEAKSEELAGRILVKISFTAPRAVGNTQSWRIWNWDALVRNDITRQYAVDEAERARRAQAALAALLYTFVQPSGAMRATQLPHLSGFAGVVTVSHGVAPAPMTSPLQKDFEADIEGIVTALNNLHGDGLALHRFGSMADFAGVMQRLTSEATPLRLE